MPIRKIADFEEPCRHPEHNPPRHLVLTPGLYEHTCPACKHKERFIVERPTW